MLVCAYAAAVFIWFYRENTIWWLQLAKQISIGSINIEETHHLCAISKPWNINSFNLNRFICSSFRSMFEMFVG